MKTIGTLCVMMLAGTSVAGAVDIKDKWGIGAGVFNSPAEASLIRGHSNRTAWVFDLSFGGSVVDSKDEYPGSGTVSEYNSNDWRVVAGPRFRRFLRPSSEFSPYWDLFLSASFGRSHRSGPVNRTSVGLGSGAGFGLEYYTPWHFSIAAHTDVFEIRWDRSRRRAGLPPYENVETDRLYGGSFGLDPRLYLRAYF